MRLCQQNLSSHPTYAGQQNTMAARARIELACRRGGSECLCQHHLQDQSIMYIYDLHPRGTRLESEVRALLAPFLARLLRPEIAAFTVKKLIIYSCRSSTKYPKRCSASTMLVSHRDINLLRRNRDECYSAAKRDRRAARGARDSAESLGGIIILLPRGERASAPGLTSSTAGYSMTGGEWQAMAIWYSRPGVWRRKRDSKAERSF